MRDTDTSKPESMVQLVEGFITESDQARTKYILRADLNNSQYLGDFGDSEDTRFGHSAFIINKTQPAVLAHTQVQVEQRPRTNMEARESGAPGVFFMSRKALLTVQSLIQKGLVDSFEENNPQDDLAAVVEGLGSDGGNEEAVPVESEGFDFSMLKVSRAQSFEVTEAFIQHVAPLMQPWQGLDGKPYNPVLKPDDIFEVNDAITAEITKNNCDIFWEEDNNDSWLGENILHNNIVGWQAAVYNWDVEAGRDHVFNIHPRHCWLPPEATSVEDAEYVVIREPMSRATAMRRFPQIAEKIKQFQPEGNGLQGSDMGSVDVGGPWKQANFERTMLSLWTAWIRNHRYPMSPDDAIDDGRVILKNNVFFLTDDEGEATDEQTDSKAENWPTRNGICQVQIVAGVEVSKEECPYLDIPVLLNKNIPIPFRWVGQGEPQRMEWLDKLIMKLGSIIFDHFKYYRSPQEIFPDDVWVSLAEQRNKMHAHPNRQMHISATAYAKYQPVLSSGRGFAVDPPRIPDSVVVFFRELLQLHDVLSGNTAELQGRTSSSDMSGKAIESLQSAARGIIGFKATLTEHMLKRLVRLRVHAMCKRGWLTPRMWKKMNDKYPTEVLGAVRTRAKRVNLNISVEVASGGGQLRQANQVQAREDFAAGLIDHETTLEKLDYPNVKQILERVQAANTAAAAQPAPMQQAA